LSRRASFGFVAMSGCADFGPSQINILSQAPKKWELFGSVEDRAQGLLFGPPE